MKILAIDSSAKPASVAITENDKLLGEFFINVGLTHSETLIPMLEDLLKNTKISVDDIDAFALTVGPGSFTGIRIGMASIKGLALPKHTPCIGISTLYSIAYNLKDSESIVCAVMDARCGQVYNAIFRAHCGTLTRLTPDRTILIEKLYEEIGNFEEKVIFVGDGALLCYNNSVQNSKFTIAPEFLRYQRASSTAFAAYDRYREYKQEGMRMTDAFVDARDLRPEYLKIPQAERELRKKTADKKEDDGTYDSSRL